MGFRGGAGKPGYPVPRMPGEEDEDLREASWYKTPMPQEHDEFMRVSKDENIPMAALTNAYATAQLVDLTDDVWSSLENTDSWEVSDEQRARQLAKRYGKDLSPIIAGLKGNSRLPAPIVLQRQDGSMTLVGGNTRLMAARALGITPKVALAKLESVSKVDAIVEHIVRLVTEQVQGGAIFTQTGGAQNARAGSSAWSSAMNQMTDEDEEGQGLWQNDLVNLMIR